MSSPGPVDPKEPGWGRPGDPDYDNDPARRVDRGQGPQGPQTNPATGRPEGMPRQYLPAPPDSFSTRYEVPIGTPPWLALAIAIFLAIPSIWAAVQSNRNAGHVKSVQEGQAVTHEKVEAATKEASAAREEATKAHQEVRRIGMARPGPFPPDDPRNQSDPVDGRDKNPPIPKEKR